MKRVWIGLLLLLCSRAAVFGIDSYREGLAIIDAQGFAGLEQAIAKFRAAVVLPAREHEARLAIARARILQFELSDMPQQGWLEEARRELEVLLQARATDADVQFLMSQLLLDENRPEEALMYLRRAALLAPAREDISGAYYYRLLDLGQAEQALLYARRRLQGETNVSMIVLLAQGMLDADLPAKALEFVQQGLSAHPEQPGLLALRALCEKALGEYAAAIATLRTLWQVAPDRNETLFEMGLLYGLLNQHEDAIAWTERFLAREPDHIRALNNLALFQEQRGEKDAALVIWRQILDHPAAGEDYRQRAGIRLQISSPNVGERD